MNTIEDAREFIVECDSMIQSIEVNPEPMYKQFEDLFGRVTNYATFVIFYQKLLQGCPNQKIVAGYDTEEEAKKCWSTIDVNNNDDLDGDECKILVQAIIKKAQELTKKYFKIE